MAIVCQQVRYMRNQGVVSRKIEGELIVVPIRSGVGDLNSLYTLNPVGSVLWEFMAEGRTIAEMVERICEEFEVTAIQAERDIEAFLDSLMEEKLIHSEA